MRNESLNQFFILFSMHAKTLMREPAVLFWGVIFPLLMALGLGLAFTQKLDTVHKVAVITAGTTIDSTNRFETFLRTRTAKSQDSLTRKEQYKISVKDKKLGNNTYVFERTSRNEAMKMLKRGEINLIVEENNAKTEFHFDPVNPEAHLTYLNLSRVINNQSTAAEDEAVAPLTT